MHVACSEAAGALLLLIIHHHHFRIGLFDGEILPRLGVRDAWPLPAMVRPMVGDGTKWEERISVYRDEEEADVGAL